MRRIFIWVIAAVLFMVPAASAAASAVWADADLDLVDDATDN